MTPGEAVDRFFNPKTRQGLMSELETEVEDMLAAGAAGRRDAEHCERVFELAVIVMALNRAVESPALQSQPS